MDRWMDRWIGGSVDRSKLVVETTPFDIFINCNNTDIMLPSLYIR